MEQTQGERVREIRKAVGLTLDKFGEKIGVKKSSLSHIENGVNALTEQNKKLICKEFNVDYIWLNTGEGEMFIEHSSDDMAIAEKITNTLLSGESEFAKNIFKVLANYSLEDWKALEHVVTKSAEYLEAIKKGE